MLRPVAADRDKILEEAQSLVEKKRFDKAFAEYQKLLAADPKDARVVLKLGEAYLKAERYENAVAAFEQVAQLHAAAGFALKAIAAYQQARDIVSKYVPHLSDRFGHLAPRVADLYVQLKRQPEAIQIYEEAAARLEAAGRPRDALDFYKKIVDLDPQTPERALRLADALVRVGDPEAAAPRFAAAAETLAARGRNDEAIEAAERAIAIAATPPLCRLSAQLYLNRGWPRDAHAAFVKVQIAYKHGPKDLETLGLLAQSLYMLRQPDRALEVHKEAARIAESVGNAEVFDAHMATLVARAAHDPEVLKLAARWSKAPPGLLGRAAPPPPASTGAPTPPPRLTPVPSPISPPTPHTPLPRGAPPPLPARNSPPTLPRAPPPPQRPFVPPPAPPPGPPPQAALPPLPPPPAPPPYGAPLGAPPPFASAPLAPPPVYGVPPLHPPVPLAPPPHADVAPLSLDPLSMGAPPSMGRGRFDEEAIEEVEFFVSQGMFEDALGILAEQLERLPNHPLLLERTREVEEMAQAARGE
jgi:tetratricopeptide (TPR) repeat protein